MQKLFPITPDCPVYLASEADARIAELEAERDEARALLREARDFTEGFREYAVGGWEVGDGVPFSLRVLDRKWAAALKGGES